jgi:hypothetical protein
MSTPTDQIPITITTEERSVLCLALGIYLGELSRRGSPLDKAIQRLSPLAGKLGVTMFEGAAPGVPPITPLRGAAFDDATKSKGLDILLMVGPNGMAACFNEQGEQIPELQGNLLTHWAEHARYEGYNPGRVVVEFIGAIPSHFRLVRNAQADWTTVDLLAP